MLGEDFAVGVVDVDDGVDLAIVNITSRLRIQVLKPRLQSQQKPGKKKGQRLNMALPLSKAILDQRSKFRVKLGCLRLILLKLLK